MNITNAVRSFLTGLVCSLLVVQASWADVVGRYSVYERESDIWLVAEVLGVADGNPRASETGLVRKCILVVSCSTSGVIRVRCIKDTDNATWLPLLTWRDDIPVLLSSDSRLGLAVEANKTEVISVVDWVEKIDDLRGWQLGDEQLPKSVVARNQKLFGVTRTTSGGAMGSALGKLIELEHWDMTIGSEQSDLSCEELTIKSRRKIVDQALKIAFTLDLEDW